MRKVYVIFQRIVVAIIPIIVLTATGDTRAQGVAHAALRDIAVIANPDEVTSGLQAVSVTPLQFGVGCVLRRVAAYKGPTQVVLKYDAKSCAIGGVIPNLVTPKGDFAARKVVGVVRNNGTLGAPALNPIAGGVIYFVYGVGFELNDEDIENSGLEDKSCVSFFCLTDNATVTSVRKARAKETVVVAAQSLPRTEQAGAWMADFPAIAVANGYNYFSGNGSLSDFDWLVHAMKIKSATTPQFRSELAGAFARFMFPNTNFSSPFDRQEYLAKVSRERDTLVDAILRLNTPVPASKVQAFGYVRLVNYDFQRSKATVEFCAKKLGNGHDDAILCGNNGGSFNAPMFQTDFLTYKDTPARLRQLADEGALAKVGQIGWKYDFNLRLERSVPLSIEVPLPESVAKTLFDVAKSSQLLDTDKRPVLTAKVFATTTLRPQDVSIIANQFKAKYEVKLRSICFFEATGSTLLTCASWK